MTREQLANFYAWQIKRGELTKSYAIMYWRSRHGTDYITALEAIDFAIGEVNEFGVLTYPDVYATL